MHMKIYKRHGQRSFPDTPFLGGYQEDVWGMYFTEIDIHGKVWRGIATIAIILASLGLYGLVTLNVSGRVREFSIRKVLGADLKKHCNNHCEAIPSTVCYRIKYRCSN